MLTALLVGISPFLLSNVSTTRPEWFQADILIISLGILYVAHKRFSGASKVLLYGLAAWSFSWTFLIKFTIIPFAVLYVAAILLERMNIRQKLLLLLMCAVSFIGNIHLYKNFQFRMTGTRVLTHDKAWLYILKTRGFAPGGKIDVSQGVHARRYLLLQNSLPNELSVSPGKLYSHIDAVNPEIRKKYREKCAFLLNVEDEMLERIYGDFYMDDSGHEINKVAHYIGLRENDTLGTKVFLEAITKYPIRYVYHASIGFARSFMVQMKNPAFSLKLGRGFGNQLFSALAVFRINILVVWTLIIASFIVILYKSRTTCFGFRSAVYGMLLLISILYVLQFNLIYQFRPKDLRSIEPLLYGLFSCAVIDSGRYLAGFIQRFPKIKSLMPKTLCSEEIS